ncbi:MAG: MBL fold metallo-hydrolase [Dermatophilaceae bacterium]
MRLTVVGCAGSVPGPGSAASCYLLEADDDERTWRFVVDLGSGSLGPLQRHTDPLALDAVLLTHLHADHFLDLNGLYVMHRYRPGPKRRPPIRVVGPPGTPQRISLAYYGRVVSMARHFRFETLSDGTPVHVGPFMVTPARTVHPVESYGFRVEACGRVVAFTGDTDSCPALAPLISGADLVLADSAFVDGRDAERGIHLSGSRAAEAAMAAGGVKRLMLTHIPAWNDPQVCRAQAAAVWDGEVELAAPGVTHEL